jgi:zinc transporter, ZIP family
METTGVTQGFLFALLTAAATGLGALPFLLAKHPTRGWLGVSNALASGLMLAASFGLVYEGVAYGLWRTLVGVVLGLGFIVLTRALLQLRKRRWPMGFAENGALDARKALLIVGVMTLHSFTEGVGVGVSFGGGQDLGLFITLTMVLNYKRRGPARASPSPQYRHPSPLPLSA